MKSCLVIMLIIFIASLHFGNCRMIKTEANEETRERLLSRNFLFSYKRELSASSYRLKQYRRNSGGRLYETEQLVPGGPNPLHNWWDFWPEIFILVVEYRFSNVSKFCFFFFGFANLMYKTLYQMSIEYWRKFVILLFPLSHNLPKVIKDNWSWNSEFWLLKSKSTIL